MSHHVPSCPILPSILDIPHGFTSTHTRCLTLGCCCNPCFAFTPARCAFLASALAVISPEILPLPSWPVPRPAPNDTYFYRTTCIRVICDIGRITPADLKSLLHYACGQSVRTAYPLPCPLSVHCSTPPRPHIRRSFF